MRRSGLGLGGALIGFGVLLGVWVLLSVGVGLRPVILPAPLAVWRELMRMLAGEDFAADMVTSLSELAGGFALGAGLGVGIGTLLARARRLAAYVEPVVESFRFVIAFSYVPLVVVWFGVSAWGKIFIVAYATFFVVALNTAAAIESVDPLLLKAGTALGLRGRRLLTRVVLPAALPRILTGLQIGLAHAWVSVIAAEYIGARAGIGFFITNAQSGLETAKVMAGLMVIGVVGSILSLLLAGLRRQLVRYEAGAGW